MDLVKYHVSKILLLLITIILLTGCKVEYNINIKNKEIKDSIIIYEKSDIVNNASKKDLDKVSEEMLDWERGYDYYKRSIYTTDTSSGYKYESSFNFDEYNYLSQLHKCYDDFTIKNDNLFKINSSSEFLCYDYYKNIDEIKINITSDKDIISSNADIKTDNKHTWIINKNNYQNKPIKIEISKIKYKKEEQTTKKKKNYINSILIITIFILLLLLLIKTNKKK